MTPKFPNIKVPLTQLDGNVFVLIGATTKAMRRGGVTKNDIDAFTNEAFAAKDYDHALQIIMRTVDCD